MISYFPTAGDTLGWAIDEDLRLLRRALAGSARETSLARSDLVHATYWPHLFFHHPALIRRRFVIAHADNPPFFYLTQPAFARAQRAVDLWVARSREAADQFRDLRLPHVHIPYAIDAELFFPIADRRALRRKYGIPEDAYVIANFHRDSEGSDLRKPKLQKSPEMMLAVLRKLRGAGARFHVLLAGPRRHWLRSALERENIPFTFAGRTGIEGDDYRANILSRPQLNELYNASDLYLIPSRWEGGPQSAMEAAAARVKMLSTPLGVARDILPPEALFDTAQEAADKILRDARDGHLGAFLETQKEKVRRDHTGEAMARDLQKLYGEIPPMESYTAKTSRPRPPLWAEASREFSWRLARRLSHPRLPRSIRFAPNCAADPSLREAADTVCAAMKELHVGLAEDSAGPMVAADADAAGNAFRLLPAGGEVDSASAETCHIAMAVQDAVNFRQAHPSCSVVVCPAVAPAEPANSTEPLVVEPGDRLASHRIWKAMREGRVPVYPEDVAYYYQVFHGGIGYGHRRTREEALRLAEEEKELFTEMSRQPSMASVVSFWRELLVAR